MTDSFEVQLSGVDGTERWGRTLGEQLEAGDLVILEGDLGTGKTTLARAVARGLGIPDNVPVASPTFAILHEYGEGRATLWHADLYRLGSEAELEEIGLTDSRAERAILLVEWGERFASALPRVTLTLRLEFSQGDERLVRVEWGGERGREIASALLPEPPGT